MTTTRALLVYVSDLHAGSTVGLLSPAGYRHADGNVTTQSPGQAWLWACWQEFAAAARKLARGRRVYLVLGGDAIDGDHHDSHQLITRNVADQRELAAEALQPVLTISDRLFVVRGTPVHDGPNGRDAEALAKELGAERAGERYSASEWPLDVAGVPVHCAHAGRGSRRPSSRNAGAVSLAADIVAGARPEDRIPRLALRSHVHLYHDSWDAVPRCRVIVSPAWQLCTEFGFKQPSGDYRADIGGVLMLADNGTIESIEVKRYAPAQSQYWRDSDRARTVHV